MEPDVVGEVEAKLVDVEAEAAIEIADEDLGGMDAEVGAWLRGGSGAGGHGRDYTAWGGDEEKDKADAQRAQSCPEVFALGSVC